MKGLSDYYKEPGIYQNALYGSNFWNHCVGSNRCRLYIAFTVGLFTFGIGAILTILAVLVVVFVFYVIAAMYLKRAFSLLAQKSGEHSFETAGTLLWIGAILTIVFGIGLILIFVAWIFATIAFFSIKGTSQPTAYAPPPPTATPPPMQLHNQRKQPGSAQTAAHQYNQTPLSVLTAENH